MLDTFLNYFINQISLQSLYIIPHTIPHDYNYYIGHVKKSVQEILHYTYPDQWYKKFRFSSCEMSII